MEQSEEIDKLIQGILPNSVKYIGDEAFIKCSSLTDIVFSGTMAKWESIKKGEDWNSGVPATYVVCMDGNAPI